MNRSGAFEQFEEACIRPGWNEMMRQMERVFQQEKKQFRAQFTEDFQRACRFQTVHEPETECAYITVEFLRSSFCRQDYRYRIVFFGSDWYFGKGNPAGMTDLSVILCFYHQLEKKLKEDAQRYVGKIAPLEVEGVMVRFLPLFQQYAKELIYYALGEATEQDEFVSLRKGAEIQIRVGECLEPGELVFLERKEKDREKLLEWLKENRQESYHYQDLRGLDFSGCRLPSRDLRYCDFRDSNLEGADLSLGRMEGARFQRSCLKDASLAGSALHGADFTKADLRNARMERTLMYDGRGSGTGWRPVGFPEGSFVCGDLRDASFRECIYCGVDFRGAKLQGVDFRGAQLFRCRFTDEQKKALELTEEQKGQIGK